MRHDDDNDQFLTRYLLGELSEAERMRLEERLFADDEYFEQLSAVEYDLIDEYVRGELAPPEREVFERTFLTSPGRRQRVEFARSVLKTIAEAAAEKPAGVMEARQESAPWWRFRQTSPALPFGLVTMLLAAVGIGTWLTIERRHLQTDLAQLQVERRNWQQQEDALRQEMAERRDREEGLTKQLQREQSERARLEQELAVKGPSKPTFLAFVLSSLARDPGEPKELVIPSNIPTIQLKIDLEEGDHYQTHRAVLQTAEGHEILNQTGLSARRISGGKAVILSVPVRVLTPGDYELQLRGLVASGTSEDIGYYYFRVIKK